MALRQHVFGAERLQAFSDAVFAIVTTIMVIPLKLEKEEIIDEGGFGEFDLASHLYQQYPKYLIYIFSFIIVVDTWYNHTRIFSIVEQVDDVILWVNLFCLLCVSFLPYATSLVSNLQSSQDVPDFSLAITIATLDIILIGISMITILVRAFRRQSLLHPEIAENKELRTIKLGMYLSLFINPILALVSMCFSFVRNSPAVSTLALVFFYPIGIASFIVRIIFYIKHKREKRNLSEQAAALFRTVANKFRTEAFSDGVFSIVATLIVLDLTTKDVPTVKEVEQHGSLASALYTHRYVFLSYVASFVIVGLLWFVQYGMFQFIKKVTPAFSIVNTATLCLVGGIPFIAGVSILFSDNSIPDNPKNNPNELTSIRMSAVVVFLAGVGQLLSWTVAWLQKDECLTEEVDKYPAEILQFTKLLVFPTVSFVIFWTTFSNKVVVHEVYIALLFSTPFIFLILKGIFKWSGACRNAVSKKLSSLKDRPESGEKQRLLVKEGEGPTASQGRKDAGNHALVETADVTHLA